MALDGNYTVTITFDSCWDTRGLVADGVSAGVACGAAVGGYRWRRRDGDLKGEGTTLFLCLIE